MKPPHGAKDEGERLLALRRFYLLDTLPEPIFDDLTKLASHICDTPIALLSLIDEKRHWFKSKVGVDLCEIPRQNAFCEYTILQRDVLIVPDARQDKRFIGNPLVQGELHIQFYAGVPLLTVEGHALGTLCVADRVPRQLTPKQEEALRGLGRQAMAQLDMRRRTHELAESEERLLKVFCNSPIAMVINRWSDGVFIDVNTHFTKLLGWTQEESFGRTAVDLGIVEESSAKALRSQLENTTCLRGAEVEVRTRSGKSHQVLVSTELVELRGETHSVTTFVDLTERKRGEEALRNSERRIRSIFESPMMGMLFWDGTGIYDANDAFLQTVGYTRDDLVSGRMNWREMTPAEYQVLDEKALAEIASTGRCTPFEKEYVCKDGARVPVLIGGASLGGNGGGIAFVLDITQRKRAEEALAAKSSTINAITESLAAYVERGDWKEAMGRLLRQALDQTRSGFGFIGVVIGSTLRVLAHEGPVWDKATSREINDQSLQNPEKPFEFTNLDNLFGRAITTGQVVISNEPHSDRRAAERSNGQPPMFSFMGVPIFAGPHVQGVIALANRLGGYSDQEQRGIEILIQHAGGLCSSYRQHEEAIVLERERTEAEAAQRESLERFEMVARATADVVYDWNLKRNEIWWNNNFQTLFGYSSEEIDPGIESWENYLHPDDKDRAIREVNAAVDSGRNDWQGEYRFRRRDGSYAIVFDRGYILRDEQGAPVRMIGAMQDITARKHSEEALRASEGRYRALFENAPDGIVIADSKSNYLDANPSICQMLGYTREEICGLNAIDIVVPAEFPNIEKALDLIKSQVQYHREWQFRRKDGSVFAAEVGATMMPDGNLLGMIRDITERKLAEQELLAAERQKMLILESVGEGIHGLNAAGQLDFENPSALAMLGWGEGEMLGKDPHSLIHHHHADGRDYPPEECPIFRTLQDGEARRVESEVFFRKDGTSFPVEYVCSPVRDLSGGVTGAVVSFRDITDRRQLEEQFRQSQKMEAIGQLAGGVAHDFNNILAAIMMQADLACSGADLPDLTREMLDDIKAATERAANLTRQLLAFSRRQVMQSRLLDLNEIVITVAKMLQRILGEDVRLKLSLHPRELTTRADAGMLDQVLLNLVVNARDAMPNGGLLVIETAEKSLTKDEALSIPDAVPGRYVCLRVIDTGCGIAHAHLSRVFEPFFTTKEPGRGTGLGLATVFGIVKQHGGSISVESESGKGTTFQIYLPACENAAKSEERAVSKSKPRGGKETILLVEDEPAVRMLTRIILERFGYHVLEAPNGLAALKMWEEHQNSIRLLLTDIVMPEGMNGFELARTLQERNPKLRVVFTSGYSADIAGRELSLQEGQNFIQKPSAPEQVLETVRRSLDS